MKEKKSHATQKPVNQHFTVEKKFKKRYLSILLLLLWGTFNLSATNYNIVDSLNLQLLPPSDSIICFGDTLHLTATPSDPGLPISWSPNDGSITVLSDSSIAIAPEQSTWYYAEISDGNCLARDSVFIEVLFLELSVDTLPARCAGEAFILKAQANIPGEYVWQPGDLEGARVPVDPKDTTLYTVYFYSQCGINTRDVLVYAAENPIANIDCFFGQGGGTPVEGFITNLTAAPANISGTTFLWNTGETTARIEAMPAAPQTNYSVTVTYPNGCSRVAEKNVEVLPAEVKMPNAFSPDGDGQNDYFRPVFMGQINVEHFQVYNRWGNLVYDNETPDTGWDGRFKGQNAASDVYLYRVVLRRINGNPQTLQGNVSLIR